MPAGAAGSVGVLGRAVLRQARAARAQALDRIGQVDLGDARVAAGGPDHVGYDLFGLSRDTIKHNGRYCINFTRIAVIVLNQFAAFGIDAVYMPASGDPVPVRVIARRPDTIVGFGETRIHAETGTFELRASEVANPRPDDQLVVGREALVVQGEPERRDPDRFV